MKRGYLIYVILIGCFSVNAQEQKKDTIVATEILNDKNIILELKEDIQLVNSQVDRCRDILHDMGRRGKDDTHMHIVPILSLIQEATEPHQKRGKTIFLKAGD